MNAGFGPGGGGKIPPGLTNGVRALATGAAGIGILVTLYNNGLYNGTFHHPTIISPVKPLHHSRNPCKSYLTCRLFFS